MTRDEILALSDADLVRHVAEQVMLPTNDPTRCKLCGWPLAETIDKGCIEGSCSMRPVPRKREWEPLMDWNHTAMVWEAMREKLFSVRRQFFIELQKVASGKLIKDEVGVIAWPDCFWFCERKHYLQAALIAVTVR